MCKPNKGEGVILLFFYETSIKLNINKSVMQIFKTIPTFNRIENNGTPSPPPPPKKRHIHKQTQQYFFLHQYWSKYILQKVKNYTFKHKNIVMVEMLLLMDIDLIFATLLQIALKVINFCQDE